MAPAGNRSSATVSWPWSDASAGRKARQQALLGNARIPERFRQASFDNFVLPNKQENPIANDKLARAMVTAKSYVREYPSPPKLGIMFQGATGVGKTHLACAVLRELAERGFECLFFDYQALLERIPAKLRRLRRVGWSTRVPRGAGSGGRAARRFGVAPTQ